MYSVGVPTDFKRAIEFRINLRLLQKADTLVKYYPDLYRNRSCVIRAGINKLHRLLIVDRIFYGKLSPLPISSSELGISGSLKDFDKTTKVRIPLELIDKADLLIKCYPHLFRNRSCVYRAGVNKLYDIMILEKQKGDSFPFASKFFFDPNGLPIVSRE